MQNQNNNGLFFLKENYAYIDNSEKTKKRSIISLFVYFLLFFVIGSFIILGIQAIYLISKGYSFELINPESPYYSHQFTTELTYFSNSWGNFIIYLLGLIIVFIIIGYSVMNDLRSLRWEGILNFFKYVGVGYLFFYITNIIASVISLFLPTEAGNEQGIVELLTSSQTNLVLMSISTIIFAPILEEIIFRKCFFNLFSRKFDTKKTIIFSSLLFGAIHIINPTLEAILITVQDPTKWTQIFIQFAYLFVYSLMGVGLGLTYQFSKRNIIPVILIHMINNFMSVLSTLLIL